MVPEEFGQFNTFGKANLGPLVTKEHSEEALRPHGADVIARRAILIKARFAERGKATVECRHDGIVVMRADVLAGRLGLPGDRLMQFVERGGKPIEVACQLRMT